ncbi:hypothetical protein SAMN05428967_4445 [Phyllobacterium sp. YR620]|uniref:hypothetical protein n=1 Tax=Phyllobacterium sp. YR620 TaxID=1881066 RepID=UPI00088A18FD|nr:hypothetical protein [Phyllobacterium sp. YR620]SDP92324.1 hypothetical protein SAMN05428967_4445 [Phyllobacterium sp. YR620]
MSTTLQHILGTAFIVGAFVTSLQLSGCTTGYNNWTPATGTSLEAYQERSCASGYYDCGLRVSGNASDHGARK